MANPRGTLLFLGATCVVGAVLRFYRLGDWSFSGEEVHTLRDSLTTVWLSGPKPLLFFLNHHLIDSWLGLDEFTLRLLPALFGVLAIPAIYVLTAGIVNRRVALLSAVLVSLSPWHIYWSQLARYYSLVFLASVLFVLSFYRAVKNSDLRWLLVSVLSLLVGSLAHPTSALLLGGLGLWTIFHFAPHWRGGQAMPRAIVAAIATLIGLAVLASAYFTPVLLQWYRTVPTAGHRGPLLLMSYFDALTAPLLLFGAAGLFWMWLGRYKSLAAALTAAAAVPIGFLVLASYLVPVYNSYLYATAPVFFLGAGYFFDRVAQESSFRFDGKLVAATCLVVVLSIWAPLIWSHYQDGSRPDYRTAALYLSDEARIGDPVVSDAWWVTRHYLSTRTVKPLQRDPAELEGALRNARGADTEALWIVAVKRLRGGFNDQDLGQATSWIRANCRPALTISSARLDYKYTETQVYRCATHRPATNAMSLRTGGAT